MKKLLKTGDHLLLGLAGIIDLFELLNEPRKNAYRNMYGWDTSIFKRSHLYNSVYYSLKTGNIEKIIKNGQTFIQLTTKGKDKIKREFPVSRWQNKRWDNKWRIVIFDIEEKNKKNRELLRRKLRELGFGMIQESVWITPYDIIVDFREFVKSAGMENQVFALQVDGILVGDTKGLVSKIWQLEQINSMYQELFKKLKNLSDRLQNSTGKDKGERKERETDELKSEYLEILRKDPCLPKELLPDDWYGEKVKKLLKLKGIF